MNARPRFPYADQDETLITLSRWQRQSEALLLSRLYGAPEAGEEIGGDEEDSTSLPPLPPLDDEYAYGEED